MVQRLKVGTRLRCTFSEKFDFCRSCCVLDLRDMEEEVAVGPQMMHLCGLVYLCRDQQVEEKRDRARRAVEEERAADAAMEAARQRALAVQLVSHSAHLIAAVLSHPFTK